MKIKGKIIAFATPEGDLRNIIRKGNAIVIQLDNKNDSVPVGAKATVEVKDIG